MSCYLSVIGKDLDVDAFVERVSIIGFEKSYKGDLISVRKRKYSTFSLAQLKISNADFENINQQIKEAEMFLLENREKLKSIAETPEIEYATINFGANATKIYENGVHSFYFPSMLLLLCGELKIAIEHSVYDS